MQMHSFDEQYWEQHWEGATSAAGPGHRPATANPCVLQETRGLPPGTALDAGCGTGAEAVRLPARGWQVTGADISATALAAAAQRALAAAVAERVEWVETDLSTGTPRRQWQLVLTCYAHPAMPQLEFYRRLSGWVAPGGTLLVVGHHHDPAAAGSGHHPPREAAVTLVDVAAGLDPAGWTVETAQEHIRSLPGRGEEPLHDVVVRATRRT